MKGILECCVDSVESAIAKKKRRSRQTGTLSGTCDWRGDSGDSPVSGKNQMDIRIHALMRPRFWRFLLHQT